MRALRFEQVLPNKRGIVSPLQGMLFSGSRVLMHRGSIESGRNPELNSLSLEFEEGVFASLGGRGTVVFPAGVVPTYGPVVSRFLAKVAVEAMAKGFIDNPELLSAFVVEPCLDLIKNHARRGNTLNWPFYAHRIYDSDKAWGAEGYQVVHEFDFLYTSEQEFYFVLAIFGMEFTINMGGPDIEGYTKWLAQNNYVSPLYWGKNKKSSS